MSEDIVQYIVPAALIVGGFLVGLICEKIILREIKKLAQRTKWEWDEVVIGALHGAPILWFTLAGVYGAILNLPIPPTTSVLIKKILVVIVIFSASVVLAKIAVGFVNLYSKKTVGTLPSVSIFKNFTRWLIILLGVLIILQALGISITPLITALGVGGLAVALALQDSLSNLFAGIHLIIARNIKTGDYIKLDSGEEGYVMDITWRNTSIRALPNNIIIVPNRKLADAIVTNFYQPQREMAILVQVGVSYDSDLEKVENVTIEVAKEVMKEVEGAIPKFEPFIRYHTFADFSINFTVILRGGEFVNQYLIKHEFIKRLHKRYAKEGIEIPFPIRTVYTKKMEGDE